MFDLFGRDNKKDKNGGSDFPGFDPFSSHDDWKKKQAEEDKEWDRLINLDTLGFFDDDEDD